jgi:hypothetical protein
MPSPRPTESNRKPVSTWRQSAISVAALLSIPLLSTGPVEAAATPTHVVEVRGSLRAVAAGNDGVRRRIRELHVLSHTRTPRTTLTFSACSGGDTRGILTVNLEITKYEYVTVRPKLQLFEGTSCNSNDLDAVSQPIMSGVVPGSSKSWGMTAKNTEFLSPDFAQANITVSNR